MVGGSGCDMVHMSTKCYHELLLLLESVEHVVEFWNVGGGMLSLSDSLPLLLVALFVG